MQEMFTDWKFYAFIVTNLLTISGVMLLKFNDFAHLTKSVKANAKKLDALDEKVDGINIEVAVLKEKTKVI